MAVPHQCRRRAPALHGCRENTLMRHGRWTKRRGPSELPRLRSGFRLRAQTPAQRHNFHSSSLLRRSGSVRMTGLNDLAWAFDNPTPTLTRENRAHYHPILQKTGQAWSTLSASAGSLGLGGMTGLNDLARCLTGRKATFRMKDRLPEDQVGHASFKIPIDDCERR